MINQIESPPLSDNWFVAIIYLLFYLCTLYIHLIQSLLKYYINITVLDERWLEKGDLWQILATAK